MKLTKKVANQTPYLFQMPPSHLEWSPCGRFCFGIHARGEQTWCLEEAIPPWVLAIVDVWRKARGSNLGFKDFEQEEGEWEMNSLRERERELFRGPDREKTGRKDFGRL